MIFSLDCQLMCRYVCGRVSEWIEPEIWHTIHNGKRFNIGWRCTPENFPAESVRHRWATNARASGADRYSGGRGTRQSCRWAGRLVRGILNFIQIHFHHQIAIPLLFEIRLACLFAFFQFHFQFLFVRIRLTQNNAFAVLPLNAVIKIKYSMIDSHIVSAGTFVQFANMKMDHFPMPSTHTAPVSFLGAHVVPRDDAFHCLRVFIQFDIISIKVNKSNNNSHNMFMIIVVRSEKQRESSHRHTHRPYHWWDRNYHRIVGAVLLTLFTTPFIYSLSTRLSNNNV